MGHLKEKKTQKGKKPCASSLFKNAGRLILFLILFFSILYTLWLLWSFTSPSLGSRHRLPVLCDPQFHREDSFTAYLEKEKEYVAVTRQTIYGKKGEDPCPGLASEKNIQRNLSFYKRPAGSLKGQVLLLHGLSDSPYAMRALSRYFLNRGLAVLALRLKGHGSVPGALLNVKYSQWQEQVREAAEWLKACEEDTSVPFYMTGFSTGAALSLSYTLDILESGEGDLPEALFFFSPAFRISPAAAVTGLHRPVSRIPLFQRFAWLDILEDSDPCKYMSFPKNAAWQIYLLSRENERRLQGHRCFPVPIYSFQSACDATVSAHAVVLFYERYRLDGYLTLFDTHPARRGQFKSSVDVRKIAREWKGPARLFIVTGESGLESREMSHVITVPWKDSLFSLSHVALPFSMDDPLYNAYETDKQTLWGEKRLFKGEEEVERLRVNPFFKQVTMLLDQSFIRLTDNPSKEQGGS
jgi:alpha-beta hydrolase superfamily lysophospholipase